MAAINQQVTEPEYAITETEADELMTHLNKRVDGEKEALNLFLAWLQEKAGTDENPKPDYKKWMAIINTARKSAKIVNACVAEPQQQKGGAMSVNGAGVSAVLAVVGGNLAVLFF